MNNNSFVEKSSSVLTFATNFDTATLEDIRSVLNLLNIEVHITPDPAEDSWLNTVNLLEKRGILILNQ